MAGGVKARWTFSSLGRHRRSESSAPAVPKEFLCPISGLVMSDPVILPSGHTFDRVCISACLDLGVDPPSSPLSPSTRLVPNLALRSSILSWSSSSSSPLPLPLQLPDAVRIVRSLSLFPSSELSPPQQPPGAGLFSSDTDSAATASGEIIPIESPQTDDDPLPGSPLEAQILGKLKSCEASEQEEALLRRRETRESSERRAALCTKPVLAALRPLLLSRSPALQSGAAACVVNLSLEPANRTPIVRSGAIPPLVSALKSLDPGTRSNAAATVFSLAVNEENKAALGALGALPPLLNIVSRPHEDAQTRRDALLALYHLTLGCSTNRMKLANLEAAGALVRIVNAGGRHGHARPRRCDGHGQSRLLQRGQGGADGRWSRRGRGGRAQEFELGGRQRRQEAEREGGAVRGGHIQDEQEQPEVPQRREGGRRRGGVDGGGGGRRWRAGAGDGEECIEGAEGGGLRRQRRRAEHRDQVWQREQQRWRVEFGRVFPKMEASGLRRPAGAAGRGELHRILIPRSHSK